jgi:hypothetical protein
VNPQGDICWYDDENRRYLYTGPLYLAIKGFGETSNPLNFPSERDNAHKIMTLVLRHCNKISRKTAVRMVEWMADPHNDRDIHLDVSHLDKKRKVD